MLYRIILATLKELLDSNQLELSSEANIESISHDLMQKMPQAGFGAHFGSWLANELCQHSMVEELFASDEELKEILHHINFHQ